MFNFHFLPFEQSQVLKTLGFPQIRKWCYDIRTKSLNEYTNDYIGYIKNKDHLITAPYNEEVINWLRVEKNVDLYVRPCFEENNKHEFVKVGYTYELSTIPKVVLNPYLKYEEAQKQGIDAALDYLTNNKK